MASINNKKGQKSNSAKGKKKKNTVEKQIETHIRKIIADNILKKNRRFVMLDSKDVVDILICDNGKSPKLFFIEIKYYTKRKDRINIGDENGDGYQPEILKNPPKYFENNLIWVFQRENDNNYYVLKTKDSSKYISGGSIGIKQNNFKISVFDDIKPLSEKDFLRFIKKWITGKAL